MEEAQLVERIPAEINGQPSDMVEQLLKDWPSPIKKRQGSEILLSGIAVWHDFDWPSVIGHPRTTFPNCKCLAARLRAECPRDKKPVLFLTSRDEIKIDVAENTGYRIVVANVTKVCNANSDTGFLANASDVPLTELIAHGDLLAAIGARARQDSKFAAAARGILGKTGIGKVDRRANIEEALRRLEACEGMEHDELTHFLTLLTKLAGTTRPLDSVFDSLADERDVLRGHERTRLDGRHYLARFFVSSLESTHRPSVTLQTSYEHVGPLIAKKSFICCDHFTARAPASDVS